ncbi:hypothetical protein MB02_15030 [Croceicoccus estronivorus]|uniref:DUF2218 domain-containing protein n=1 Tax=Croceicoccus estronivorus TaxID=1172626 RepID=UPI0008367BCF|nr:DUF2218 domain-containing protein [Croceicoccus estronivorus]OCC22729.1 hypothetical protein MB02_15030 [Croceicoccus estronivorus]
MTTAIAMVSTANGGKYIRQLCKHWSHKLDVEQEGQTGVVRFPDAVATMEAGNDAIRVKLVADDQETVLRLQDVIERHLDRFAFREAPLLYKWKVG